MACFPKNDRFKIFKYLVYLHYIGLISLPDYHESERRARLHKYVYRGFVYGCACIMILCQFINTFFYAIYDMTEFLQRLVECLYFVTFFLQGFIFNVKLQRFIDLVVDMDRIFVPCKNKYRYKEYDVIKIMIGLCLAIVITFSLDTFLPAPDQVKETMLRVYNLDPLWRLPFPIWLPFKINSITVFSLAIIFEFYLIFLVLTSIFQLVLLETVISLPIVEQYEIFRKHVELIGVKTTDKLMANPVCTTVGKLANTSELLLQKRKGITLVKSKSEHVDIEIADEQGEEMVENEPLIRQIITQNQRLNLFIHQFKQFLRLCTGPIFYPTIAMVPLSTYKLVRLSQLPTTTAAKNIVEYLFVMYGLTHYIHESERFDTCYKLVRDGILNSKWYLAPPDTRRAVCIMLRIVQQSNIITYFSGFIKFNYNFLLKTLRGAYSFANFMHLMEKL